MLAVRASGIGARQQKQRGRPIDHDAPGVRAAFGDTRSILDVELKADQIRDLFEQPWSIVLALTPLRKS